MQTTTVSAPATAQIAARLPACIHPCTCWGIIFFACSRELIEYKGALNVATPHPKKKQAWCWPGLPFSSVCRCPSDKKPKSPVSAIAMSTDEATLAVGCEDGSLHGMKLSQGGMGVQHAWSKPVAAGAASVLAIDMSTDGKVWPVRE